MGWPRPLDKSSEKSKITNRKDMAKKKAEKKKKCCC